MDGHVSPIDTEALWNDLQKKQTVPAPNKRRTLFLFFMLGLLGISLITFLCTKNNNKQQSNIKQDIQLVKDNLSTNGEVENHKGINAIDETLKAKERHTSSTNTNESHLLDVNANRSSSDKLEKGSYQDGNLNQSKPSTKTKSSTEQDPSSSYFQKPYVKLDRFESNSDLLRDNKKDKNQFNLGELSTKESDESLFMNSKKESIGAENNKNNTAASKSDKEIALTETNNKQSLSSIYDNPLLNIRWNLVTQDFDGPDKKVEVPEALNKLKRLNFEIGSNFNYEYVFRNIFDATDDSTFIGYAELRDENEKFVESFRTGLFVRKTFKGGFRVTLGFNYAQLTERFENKRIEESVELNPNSLMGTLFTTTTQRITFNRYKSYSIPLTIGKSFQISNWAWHIDAGVLYNHQFQQSGRIFLQPDNDIEFYNLANEEDISQLNRNKQYLSWLASASVSYGFGNGIRLEFGPQIHSSFKSSLKERLTESKRHFVGMNVGLSKRF